MSNYEVLEIVKEGNTICGFHIHFSNGQRATFIRKSDGIDLSNIIVRDNELTFFVGDCDKLEEEWKINGVSFNRNNGNDENVSK